METPHDISRLKLLFTTTYIAQCFTWMSFLVYLAFIGPPTLAVMLVFPVEISWLTKYFLQLSIFLNDHSWITCGLIVWTSSTSALLLPKLLNLFTADKFSKPPQRFMAYASILNTCFSLCLGMFLIVVGSEALFGPIDCILEATFGSRLDFLHTVLSHHLK